MPYSGEAPLTVIFTNTSSETFESFLWNFGDGKTAQTTPADAVIPHVYDAEGSYTVTLTATGQEGSSTNIQNGLINVSVPAQPQITGMTLVDTTNLVIQGAGGPTNGGGYNYWLLSSTNITLPLAEWNVVSTNLFNPDGSFSNQIPAPTGTGTMFYRLKLP